MKTFLFGIKWRPPPINCGLVIVSLTYSLTGVSQTPECCAKNLEEKITVRRCLNAKPRVSHRTVMLFRSRADRLITRSRRQCEPRRDIGVTVRAMSLSPGTYTHRQPSRLHLILHTAIFRNGITHRQQPRTAPRAHTHTHTHTHRHGRGLGSPMGWVGLVRREQPHIIQ